MTSIAGAALACARLAAASRADHRTRARDTPEATDPSATGILPTSRTSDAAPRRAAIAADHRPDQAASTLHRIPVPDHATGVGTSEETLAGQTGGYPHRTVVSGAHVRSEQLWASHVTLTFTCVDGDHAVSATLAGYQ